MGEESKKVGGNGKSSSLGWLLSPFIKIIFGSLLFMVALAFALGGIVGLIAFGLWAILHPRRAPEKFLEILVTLGDLRENTKEKLRPWRW